MNADLAGERQRAGSQVPHSRQGKIPHTHGQVAGKQAISQADRQGDPEGNAQGGEGQGQGHFDHADPLGGEGQKAESCPESITDQQSPRIYGVAEGRKKQEEADQVRQVAHQGQRLGTHQAAQPDGPFKTGSLEAAGGF